jgi:two-component system, OmpR family, phosphate regulon sensor histidine kinase PhoR
MEHSPTANRSLLGRFVPTTVRWRLAITYIALIFLVMGGLGIYLASQARELYVDRLADRMVEEANIISRSVLTETASGNVDQVDARVKQLGSGLDVRITVIAPDGTVLGDSEADPRQMENHSNRPEVQEALATGFGESERTSATVHTDFMYVAVPVDNSSGAVVRVATPLNGVNSAVRDLQRDVLIASVVAALLATAVAIAVSNRIIAPLNELREQVTKVTAGQLDVAVVPANPRELGDLARAFNVMTKRVSELVSESEISRLRLEAIFANLSDGVVIVNEHADVVGINASAGRILNAPEQWAVGQPFVVVARDHELVSLLKSAIVENAFKSASIDVGRDGQVVEAAAQPLQAVGERFGIVVVRDVTELKRLESVRREFVANVSHELRTPLASIKALVETLEAGALDDPTVSVDFLGRINGEVDRLAALVDELLDLGRLESGRVGLRLELLDPADLLRRGAERLRPQIERAQLHLSVSVSEGLPPVLADRARIEQVLLNLVHNAIKFTPAGGTITVSAEARGGYLSVSVTDTGIGMSESELQRVFERFYKADRSRRSEGSGLGLAIAKHIVLGHQGAITATSEEGKGSSFSFTLPFAPSTSSISLPPAEVVPAFEGLIRS